MINTGYIQKRESLISSFSNGLPICTDEHLNGQFTLVSAGLHNYLPGIEFQKHEDIFTNLLLHKKLSTMEQGASEALHCTTVEHYNHDIAQLLGSRNAIICTFHTGSYRLINLFLAHKGIPFSLVVGKDVIEKEGERFLYQFKDICGKHDELEIIDAESSQTGFQMLRVLKTGRSLVVYMDGNTGAGNATASNSNHCLINFLQQQVFTRKGIGFIAHAANVPILPVICYRPSFSDIRLRFFEPVYPDKNMERSQFAEQIIQMIYDIASPFIQQYSEQWEGWLYLHKVAHIIYKRKKVDVPPKRSDLIRFNTEAFGLYKISGRPLLFEKTTYISYPIDKSIYELFSESIANPIEGGKIEAFLFDELADKGVLLKI